MAIRMYGQTRAIHFKTGMCQCYSTGPSLLAYSEVVTVVSGMTQREGRPGTGRPLSSRIGSKLGPSLMIHLAFFHRFVLLHGLLLHLLELGLLFGCEHTVDLLVE